MPHEELKNEVLQKIGRNLLHFQRFEYALKEIIPMISLEGPISRIETIHAAKKEKLRGLSAGQLRDSYLKIFDAPDQNEACEVDTPQEITVSCIIRFPYSTPEFREEKRAQVQDLIDKRNDFVHNIWPRINFESSDNLGQIIQELDSLQEETIRELDFLKSISQLIIEYGTHLKELSDSNAGKNLFYLLREEDRLITILVDLLNKSKRADGGCTVSQAGIVIAKEIPHLITPLKQLYQCKTLAQLISVIDNFEIYEEVTEKGIRTLFKAKHG